MSPKPIRYIAVESSLSCEIQGECVLLHNGVYLGLNGVASHVWSLLRGGATIGEIVGSTVEKYDVSREQCEADVADLLRVFAERQLVLEMDVVSETPCSTENEDHNSPAQSDVRTTHR